MTKKSQDAFSDFMKLFDPANVSKMFDLQTMMEQFGAKQGNFDPNETIQKTKDSFAAMTKANEAAAASYRDLMEKQLQIFKEVTSEAAERLKSGPEEDFAATYQQAVERALGIMTELSQASQRANQQAFDAIKVEVDKAIKDLKG